MSRYLATNIKENLHYINNPRDLDKKNICVSVFWSNCFVSRFFLGAVELELVTSSFNTPGTVTNLQ